MIVFFSAIPSGNFYGIGCELLWWEKELHNPIKYNDLNKIIYLYTSTMSTPTNIKTISIYSKIALDNSEKGMSIRCIKD